MSKRHKHRQVVLPPTIETRAHAHSERHRVNSELHLVANLVSHGVEPDDVIEPGPAWKPLHHHDAEIGIEQSRKQDIKHSAEQQIRCYQESWQMSKNRYVTLAITENGHCEICL